MSFLAGSDLTDVGSPLPLLRGRNGKVLINLRKAENCNMVALQERSIKISKSLLECPTITALGLPLTQNRSMTRNC